MQTIVLAVFALTFSIIAGAYWLFVGRPETEEIQTVKKRLRGSKKAPLLLNVVKTDDALSTVPAVDAILRRYARVHQWIQQRLVQSGLSISPASLLIGSAGAVLLAFATVLTLTGLVIPAIGVGAAAGALPIFFVKQKAASRMARFEEQFPEAIDLLARSLRAGHALTTALQLAGKDMPDPVGPEFQLLFDRQNYGMSLSDAMREFALRVPILDARFFVTAVLIQRETGGNLAAVFDNLASVIRERFKVKRQVRVLSAHGRITGWVLGMLPPAIATILSFISPNTMIILFRDPLGVKLVAVGLGLQAVGVLAIRRIVDVEY